MQRGLDRRAARREGSASDDLPRAFATKEQPGVRREQDALAVRLRATIGRVSSAAVALACKPRGTVAERFRPHRQRDKTSQIAPPNKAPGQRSGRAAVPSTTPTGGDALRRGHLEGSPNKAPGTRSRARMVDRLVRHRSCPAPQPEKNRQSPNPRANICSFARKGPLPKTNGSGSFVTGAANDDHGDETQNRELGKDPHGLESAHLETRAPPAHVKQSLPQSSKRTPQEKAACHRRIWRRLPSSHCGRQTIGALQ